MKWKPVIIGGLLLTSIGLGVWLSLRKQRQQAAALYDVQPLYRLPRGLRPVEIGIIDRGAVGAVKLKHKEFELHEAYIDTNGALYLVETHKGFEPLVFKVTEKG